MNWRLLLPMFVATLARALTSTCQSSIQLGEVRVALTVLEDRYAKDLDARPICGVHEADGNLMHRVFFDSSGRPVFGYDLRVTPSLQDLTIRVEVLRPKPSFTVAGYWGYWMRRSQRDRIPIDGGKLASFSELPAPVTIGDGDRVDMPVLQNPRIGARLVDSMAIAIRGTGVTGAPNFINDFPQQPPADSVITIQQPQLASEVSVSGENPRLGATAPVVWIYSRWCGRFLFSATPRPGYRRNAVATGSKIGFTAGVEHYTLRLRANVVAQPGTWWLWVKCEPEFKPPLGPWTEKELHDGLLAIGVER